MAILSFNPSRIRHPLLQTHKPISNFTCLTEFPFQSLAKSPKNKLKSVHHLPSCSISEASISSTLDAEDDPTAELVYLDPEIDPQSITEWELDFCSRPILDIRGKKLWELVVCDNSLSLRYTKYFPNNVINSITLKDALVSISDDLGVPLPDKIRFFRERVEKRVVKALLITAIEFVQSSWSCGFLKQRWFCSQIDEITVIIDENRAWMNGLEVCSIEADVSKASLILSVGISTRYIYATYKKNPVSTSEAEAWEAAKKACGGLHFLAIQNDLNSDDCVGLWLLLDLPPPPV
ncbi:hypothetical protein RND71_019119 [Anisodus tanguticus]|uniref:Uncharacterized protein n=1 Tax=Anisodus tanguticus TaxID=243964 RepID=A0AAE1RZY7_9SOLA|nr:hypothetical protein RND71_019119 [Anisodus tanguticus]